jgi:diguanylate cyclase (GGDEF)-like protein
MKKILIIEDDKTYAKALKNAILKNTNVKEVATLHSLEELEKIDITKFNLIISDVFMKNYNEDYIKENILSQNIPTILITGLPDKVMKKKLQKLNIVDFIIKTETINFNQIINKIKILNYLKNNSILIVDDSSTSILINAKVIKKHYPFTKILTAKNGKEALEKIEENKDIKLIMTDYEMPEMDGMKLIQNIRNKHNIDEKIIIAISGAEEKETSFMLLRVGANDFLHKPIIEEELMCRIDNNIKTIMLIEEIKDMAYKDALTKLYNRRYFFEIAHKMFLTAKRENKPISILMFDIDHFKNLNDRYGHQTGDLVIQKTAQILQNNIRKNDIACRYGGEEFVIFLYNCDLNFARLIGEKIRKTIENLTLIDNENREIRYTISVGISNKGETLEKVIKHSDEMLYKAKETRNRVIVDK